MNQIKQKLFGKTDVQPRNRMLDLLGDKNCRAEVQNYNKENPYVDARSLDLADHDQRADKG